MAFVAVNVTATVMKSKLKLFNDILTLDDKVLSNLMNCE